MACESLRHVGVEALRTVHVHWGVKISNSFQALIRSTGDTQHANTPTLPERVRLYYARTKPNNTRDQKPETNLGLLHVIIEG